MEFPNIVETKSKGEKMYLISAYFDEHTTRQLQRFIDAVAQNTGNTYMIDNNVPPHLTISSFETRNPQNLCDDFVITKTNATAVADDVVEVDGSGRPICCF